jgi:hypothetical protein
MIPQDILLIKAKKSGKFALLLDHDHYVMVEVDEQGLVHQLKVDGVTRDGVLRDTHWHTVPKAFIIDEDGTWTRVIDTRDGTGAC